LLVLSSLALAYGGLLLVSGLTNLRDPLAAARIPITQPLGPDAEAAAQRLAAVRTTVAAQHQRAIRANALASVVLALALLYAAAAALARDRHGRTATLLAAWLGIAYQLASLLVMIRVARGYLQQGAPLLVELAARTPGGVAADADLRPETLTAVARAALIGGPVLATAMGVGGSVVLIVFFGGRRGRALYGLGPSRGEP
jgi:hypothetical protein